jgi:hypothetical protein
LSTPSLYLERMNAYKKTDTKANIQESLALLGIKVTAEKLEKRANVQTALAGLIATDTLLTRLKAPNETAPE